MAETTGERLAAVWARTDRIFEILAPEAIFAQPIALRHPFIFYVGHLPAFSIDATPVTNGEFLAFVDDGGYGRRELWVPDDWDWNHGEERRHPATWTSQDCRWLY